LDGGMMGVGPVSVRCTWWASSTDSFGEGANLVWSQFTLLFDSYEMPSYIYYLLLCDSHFRNVGW
ncbi:MAG: hypothetical protein ACXVDN_18855, partial [Ktedonobacteraceae bacterium]